MIRALGFFHLVALGVNATIGSGIFLIPGKLAASLGIWSIGIFLLCAALLNFVALTFARLARLTDRNGGSYLYAALAFGPRTAFLVGWIAWVCAVVSCSAVANGIGFYLSHFTSFAFAPWVEKAIAGGAIVLFGIVNYFGVSYGGRTVAGLTILKTLPLLFLAGAGALRFFTGDAVLPTMTALPPLFSVEVSAALLMALFTCQGFEVVPIIAGETKQPFHSVPRAILLSLWVSVALYSVLQLAIVGIPSAVGSEKPLADAALVIWGPLGGNLVAIAGLISVIGFVAGIALTAPRYLTALCEDRLLPESFSVNHPRFNTPTRAIYLTTGASLLFSLSSGVNELIALSSLATAIQYLISCLALFVLVRQSKTSGRWLAVAGFLVSLFFLLQIPSAAWISFAGTSLLGLVLHWTYLRRYRGFSSP